MAHYLCCLFWLWVLFNSSHLTLQPRFCMNYESEFCCKDESLQRQRQILIGEGNTYHGHTQYIPQESGSHKIWADCSNNFLIAWVMAENSRAALYLSQKVLQVQIVKLYFLQDLDLASEPSTLQQYSARTKGLWHFTQSTPGHHNASMNVIFIVYFPKVLRVDLSENALGCVKEESCIGF